MQLTSGDNGRRTRSRMQAGGPIGGRLLERFAVMGEIEAERWVTMELRQTRRRYCL